MVLLNLLPCSMWLKDIYQSSIPFYWPATKSGFANISRTPRGVQRVASSTWPRRFKTCERSNDFELSKFGCFASHKIQNWIDTRFFGEANNCYRVHWLHLASFDRKIFHNSVGEHICWTEFPFTRNYSQPAAITKASNVTLYSWNWSSGDASRTSWYRVGPWKLHRVLTRETDLL